MYARIYNGNLSGMYKEESLKNPYHVQVLSCLVDVKTGATFCWIRIFESHVDVIHRGHHIPEGLILHPHEAFYTTQLLLIPIEIIDGKHTCVSL